MAARKTAATREAKRPVELAQAPPMSESTVADPPPSQTPPVAKTLSVAPPEDTATVAKAADPGPESASDVVPHNPYVIVYYFHRTLRCHSCLQIEEWARQAVANAFFNELAAGIVEWRTVNMELEENKHFVEDYRLKSPALVLVHNSAGAPASWKDLENVWEHLSDHVAFGEYVTDEIKEFLAQP